LVHADESDWEKSEGDQWAFPGFPPPRLRRKISGRVRRNIQESVWKMSMEARILD
jgi:hypothetical protein